MSPTVLRVGSLRFYVFSREEPRLHVHVEGPDGEAKVWLEPVVELALNHGLTERDLRIALAVVREKEDVIRTAWTEHFGA